MGHAGADQDQVMRQTASKRSAMDGNRCNRARQVVGGRIREVERELGGEWVGWD